MCKQMCLCPDDRPLTCCSIVFCFVPVFRKLLSSLLLFQVLWCLPFLSQGHVSFVCFCIVTPSHGFAKYFIVYDLSRLSRGLNRETVY